MGYTVFMKSLVQQGTQISSSQIEQILVQEVAQSVGILADVIISSITAQVGVCKYTFCGKSVKSSHFPSTS